MSICIYFHPNLLSFNDKNIKVFLTEFFGKENLSSSRVSRSINAYGVEELFIFVEFEKNFIETSSYDEFFERIENNEVVMIMKNDDNILWNSLDIYDIDDKISVVDYKKLPSNSRRWNIPNPIDQPIKNIDWFWTCSKAERTILNGKANYDVCQIRYVTIDRHYGVKRERNPHSRYSYKNTPYRKWTTYRKWTWFKDPPRDSPTPPPYQEPLSQVELFMLRRILNKNSKQLEF